MKIRLNGEQREIDDGMTVSALFYSLNISELSSAVELNSDILDKKDYGKTRLNDGDLVEIISFVGGGAMSDTLIIAGIEFGSRLWVGTGKYKDFMETKRAIEASGADVVTVAVRRVNSRQGQGKPP